MMNNNKIGDVDLVYLWVDGNDPVWQAKRNATIGKTVERSAENCEGRYANHDELLYSLRSVEMYAPWIRNIFIVTDNQVPEWLDTSNSKIRVIDHKDIMPAEALPCFNSSVIEHFVCEIPDLSEHFLYANDDMFFNRPTTVETFFAPDGMPIIRQSRRPFRKLTNWFSEKVRGKTMSHYNRIVQNGALLVEKKFGKYFSGKAHHNIDSYLKSDLKRIKKMFINELAPTFPNHVRKDNDIQRSLYHYAALAEKRGLLRYVTQHESLRIHNDNPKHLDKLKKYNPLLFCVNDSQYASEKDRERSSHFLRDRFPRKSQFEK